jgi:ribosomal protein S26
MPVNKSYTRGWKHKKGRGKETTVTCSFCGKMVPKYKTFSVVRGFRITDPLLRDALGAQGRRGGISLMNNRMRACPGCARHRHIVRKKKR